MQNRTLICLIVVLSLAVVFTPIVAAQYDAYIGDVLMIAWLEDDYVKVALANESFSRKSVALASNAWDQRWRSSVFERTILVPARTVVIEAFPLSQHWRGETLEVEAKAWESRGVVEVQTSRIFRPSSYVVQAREQLEVPVDLAILQSQMGVYRLVVDDYTKGTGIFEPGLIQIETVDGGFKIGRARNSVEFVSPRLTLSMNAPRPMGDTAAFTFSIYKQRDSGRWSYAQDEIPGPVLLVYSRSLDLQDNSHLARPQAPTWNW